MREAILDLPFPAKGLVSNVAYDDQPSGTTALAQNVRLYDPRAGRDRGGQRSGMRKYCPAQVSGAHPIQELTHNVYVAANATLSQRVIRPLAVSQGNIKRFTSAAVSTPTGGIGALSSTAKVIFSAQLFNQTYFADGVNFKYYNAPTDAVLTLTASAGALPVDGSGNAPRLVTVWRQRLVFAGLPLDPNNWFMSACGDATNWDYNPFPSVETQAVAGNNTTAGEAPDMIHCLIPYNDEVLVMGCAHSIWQVTGDPMAGGRIDLVADAVGMAWGAPWCRDGLGTVYFTSSRGAVYKFVPGGLPERISDQIAESLLTIENDDNIVRMAWDERQFGFHLWISPTAGPAATTHYFYDTRAGAWWPDVYANNNFNPLAVHALDGDIPGDRIILLGGLDGYIRALDPAALDDDGTAIDSRVSIGPLRDKEGNSLTLADLQCQLDTQSGGVSWEVFAGPSAQEAFESAARFSGKFAAGRNRSQAVRLAGNALYVELASANLPGSAWAIEFLRGRVRTPEGKTRQRSWAT